MAQLSKPFPISEDSRKKLHDYVEHFCSQDEKQKQHALARLKQHLTDYSQLNSHHIQAMGIWVYHFLQELIPFLVNLSSRPEDAKAAILNSLLSLPLSEDSDLYKSVLSLIEPSEVAPLTPPRYFQLMQMAYLLTELGYKKSNQYLEELLLTDAEDAAPNLCRLLVRMLAARAEGAAGHYLDEQLVWLDLVFSSCGYVDKHIILYFLIQWVISLQWVRPNSLRKELLLSLYAVTEQTDVQNQALILYELFNLPDKTVSSADKRKYLDRMQALPTACFSVSQLQSIYYVSGSLKSTDDAGFMHSVSDFKYSNYYIHKYWGWIGDINKYFHKHFPPAEYQEILKNIEHKTRELINLINIQSNAFVESLEDSYKRIEELYHKVEELSIRDTLTGLYNRRFLYNNIKELLLLAIRQQSPLSFAVIDIDDFKPINDTHGHLAGDFILSELSAKLKNFFRKSDFIVRYGGEEFLVVMFNADHLQTEQTMNNLRLDIMNSTFRYKTKSLKITVSIGIASCQFTSPYSTVDLEKLISEADSAMYESKTTGKNVITSRLIYF
jgi:diguanylate cyclase (GGDEF)-like protein